MTARRVFAAAETVAAVVSVVCLSLLPLAIKLVQQGFGVPVVGSDAAIVNLVFVFTCIAGVVTWRADRHISLASLSDTAPQKVRAVIRSLRSAAVSAVLTALFFAAFSETFAAFAPGSAVWGVPLPLIFAVLPASYAVMLAACCAVKENRLASVAGILAGLFVSAGPIGGVLYYLFGLENLNVLYALGDCWLSFSSAAFVPLMLAVVALALLGVPLFIVISAAAYIAFSQGGGYVEVLSLEAYGILTDKSIAAIPLFTIAGYILSKGSAGSRLVAVFKSLFGWFRGGAVVAAVVVATFFTTFTGVSGVTILALGSLLTMALAGSGYSKTGAQALVTSSGALGLLFPPSVAIIMYGTTNYFSVDVFDLFRGAIIPGCILAVSMIALGFFKDKRPETAPFSAREAFGAVKNGAFELLMPALICAGYFSGFFSLLETASFAVVYAFCLTCFIRRDFTLKGTLRVVAESIPVSGGVLIILGAARGLSYFLIDANVPVLLSDFISSFVSSKYVFLILLNLVLLVVGCMMDIYSAILIVSPLVIPIAESFGISAVHTGVIFLMNMQLGFLTPPVGMDLFIASYAFDTPVMKVVKGILPFLLVQFIVLLLVTYVPWFTEALL
ncbi:TRAP transporter large permease subunit [Treponema brennaborense]|uniref:TRAP dicarboxylate transporter, DctM subunit n=1 Tax=Treponema brennaborense (strain DSM 12168 / CIP 105900 / DD5/3) TaxID=906968 RepID=F4LJ22_TREBD|nr:TRAP transporter large permease subunit [Treponema brennaborense]AEE17331.1 TRAP dicarboxylate transporter, DctM subunit [Treponema brennaborense DSM 12168]